MNIGSSPAELLYGTTLRIPGEFILPDDFNPDPKIFLEEFREHIYDQSKHYLLDTITKREHSFTRILKHAHTFFSE